MKYLLYCTVVFPETCLFVWYMFLRLRLCINTVMSNGSLVQYFDGFRKVHHKSSSNSMAHATYRAYAFERSKVMSSTYRCPSENDIWAYNPRSSTSRSILKCQGHKLRHENWRTNRLAIFKVDVNKSKIKVTRSTYRISLSTCISVLIMAYIWQNRRSQSSNYAYAFLVVIFQILNKTTVSPNLTNLRHTLSVS